MRIAKIVGNVTLSRSLPEFQSASLKLAFVLGSNQLQNKPGKESILQSDKESLVIWDGLAAGCGSMVTFSEGAEAARPLHPKKVPIDAAVAALIDQVDVR